jgi:diaminopimelate decarboxylase
VISHRTLARQFGTPLYVYDLDRVARSYRDLRESLPAELRIFYSLKANPHPEIAGVLRDTGDGAGCRAEVSSAGELAAALDAGFAPGECLYTGPGKTEDELHNAILHGVRNFSAESPTDLERTGRVAARFDVTVDCLLRINSRSSQAPTSIRMTGTPSQFGFDDETLAERMPDLLSVPGTRLIGAHLFSQSNARDEASLIAELTHSVVVAARLHDDLGLPMRFLDLGGGFGCPYAVPGERVVYQKLRHELEISLDRHFPRWRAGDPEVACESGRYLVGDCGRLITGVTNIKDSRGQRFVVLDAGINTLGGLSGLGRMLPVAVMPDAVADAGQTAHLVGPLCTPGDLLGRNVRLPDLSPGDTITIPNVGAYGVTASLLQFLSRPAPREVIVGGGRVISVSQLETRRVYASDHGASSAAGAAAYSGHESGDV